MKCHHPACSCQAEAGQEYCSTECHSHLADEGGSDCHCGHEQCLGSTEPDRDSDR
jgi:hypothetical protein